MLLCVVWVGCVLRCGASLLSRDKDCTRARVFYDRGETNTFLLRGIDDSVKVVRKREQ